MAMTIVALLSKLSNRQTTRGFWSNHIIGIGVDLHSLLPASHVLVLGTVVAERLLYLPQYWILHACFSTGGTYPQATTTTTSITRTIQIIMALLVVVLAAFAKRILSRNVEWSTTVTLWKADYHSHPSNVKIALAYAADLHQAGRGQ